MAKVFIMGISLMTLLGCATERELPKSDHYNGKKFINPTLETPFSPGFSDIYKMMREGRPKWPKDVENLGRPNLNETLQEGEFSLTFINHATFLIQTPELNILTDPVWSKRASPFSWLGPKRVRKPAVELETLPRIDVILISHNHYDHLDKSTLKKLNKRFSPKVFVPIGDGKLMESIGFKKVQELDWWDCVTLTPSIEVSFTPSQHSSARGLFDRDKSLWGSYFLQLGKRSLYYGGDSGYSTHFSAIKERLGSPELAILGIGAYEPDFFMKAIHTSPLEAVQAHKDLGASQSIGMHYGTFQLASEGFEQPQLDLKIALEKEGLADHSFITLLEGETKFYCEKTYQ